MTNEPVDQTRDTRDIAIRAVIGVDWLKWILLPAATLIIGMLAYLVIQTGGISERMISFEHRMGALEQRMGALEQRMGALEERMDWFEQGDSGN